MIKVLFVCLGNICRSPLAEGVLEALAHSKGLDISVDSAGTSQYHLGDRLGSAGGRIHFTLNLKFLMSNSIEISNLNDLIQQNINGF